jgi:hypothetical protein
MEKTTQTTAVPTNKQKIKLEISREAGKTYLTFEVDKTLETIFEKQSSEVRESESWKGLKFYYAPDVIDSTAYQNLLYEYGLQDNYGVPIYSNRKFNIAFLRTVGGQGKILIKNDIPFAMVSDYMKKIITFIKRYYEDFLKDYKVKGFLTFEV